MYVQLTMAERLKDLRVIDKKLTLEQLAEQTGLSKSALGKYESEDCGDINHYAIQKLAKFYGVSTDYLLGLKNKKITQMWTLPLTSSRMCRLAVLFSGRILHIPVSRS